MNRIALVTIAFSLFVATGCSSTTVIKSYPAGAIVRNAAGEKVCKTPCTWTGNGTINATDTFSISKKGYEDTSVTIRKDQVNGLAIAGLGAGALLTLGTLIGPVAFIVPMFWMADYKPIYEVELERVAKKSVEDDAGSEDAEDDRKRRSRDDEADDDEEDRTSKRRHVSRR